MKERLAKLDKIVNKLFKYFLIGLCLLTIIFVISQDTNWQRGKTHKQFFWKVESYIRVEKVKKIELECKIEIFLEYIAKDIIRVSYQITRGDQKNLIVNNFFIFL